MDKPIKFYPVAKMYDYNAVIDFIEKKYNINTRNMGRDLEGVTTFEEWCDIKGYGEYDPDKKHRGASQIWFAEWEKEVAEGLYKEVPYLDFWHWVFNQDDEIRNRSNSWISAEVLKEDYTDYKGKKIPDFVRKVLNLINDEGFFEYDHPEKYKDDGFTFWVEW